ncbi:hypothetical protein, partial [uncultured Muribaculum sp.]|uniref:hypothetical protein n=1 Tax=uncultured Muribaculum sp. TaxID=1918613 RepID=UPI0025B71049
ACLCQESGRGFGDICCVPLSFMIGDGAKVGTRRQHRTIGTPNHTAPGLQSFFAGQIGRADD